jgi:hypothetical protein
LWIRLTILVCLAILPAGCARKDPQVESLIGSEPQRLSFGAPPQVLHSFVEKMKVCWFDGPRAVLAGYHYETGEQQGPAETFQDIKIFSSDGSAEAFEVQFHQYNENTLIVTKNISMPPDILTRISRDIQLWPLSGTECNGP